MVAPTLLGNLLGHSVIFNLRTIWLVRRPYGGGNCLACLLCTHSWTRCHATACLVGRHESCIYAPWSHLPVNAIHPSLDLVYSKTSRCCRNILCENQVNGSPERYEHSALRIGSGSAMWISRGTADGYQRHCYKRRSSSRYISHTCAAGYVFTRNASSCRAQWMLFRMHTSCVVLRPRPWHWCLCQHEQPRSFTKHGQNDYAVQTPGQCLDCYVRR